MNIGVYVYQLREAGVNPLVYSCPVTPVARAAAKWHKANEDVEEAKAALAEAIHAALAEGVSEREIARQAGVNRLTVRRILGKG